MKRVELFCFGFVSLTLVAADSAQVPSTISYQGSVAVSGMPFTGTGYFKFALVIGMSPEEVTQWSNDGTGAAGSEPLAAVELPVSRGHFSLRLGDEAHTNMIPISPGVFENGAVRLRVWFDDGVHGFQRLEPDQVLASVPYALQADGVPDGSVTADKFAPGAVQAGLNEGGLGGVPEGGVILSRQSDSESLTDAGYVRASQVRMPVEAWETRSTLPGARTYHTAVWTGQAMLVWGGGEAGSFLDTGGRYDPASDTWRGISTTNSPAGRWNHGAVWTGSEMLIWGGRDQFFASQGNLGDGGRYDPSSDSWEPISAVGTPSPRSKFACVWTGTEMLIWGGVGDGAVNLNDGARYHPPTDSWTPISPTGAPSPRSEMAAVWTGTEMVVWGGGVLTNTAMERIISHADGARYNPATNEWTPISDIGAPPGAAGMAAVWTGREMLIWGGSDWGTRSMLGAFLTLSSGGRYDPRTDSWSDISVLNAPIARAEHTGIWTGSEFLIWGGVHNVGGEKSIENSGARYDPEHDFWTPLPLEGAPSPRVNLAGVWTGDEWLLFGGYPGAGPGGFDSLHAWVARRLVYLYERPAH